MNEFYELIYDHDRHCATFWDRNETMELPRFGEHHYLSKVPLRFDVRRKQFGDMIWTSWPRRLFISNRLREIFESVKLSGYEALPAKANLIFEHEPAEAVYWQIGVTGWGGIASPDCGLKCVDNSVSPRLYTKEKGEGRVIEPTQWDGSDFFAVWPTPGYYVTEKVVKTLNDFNVRYYRIQSPDLYRHFKNEQLFTGLPLQCWFRDDRAREIGERLGIYWWEEN